MDVISKIDIRGDERILDIGCGDGKITSELATLVPEGSVAGIDCSEEMIRFAKSRFPQSMQPNLEFQLGDARSLGFIGEFDLVVSFACLHWVLDHIPVLEGIRRSLKPSGRIFLQFGGRGNAEAVVEIAENMISSERWARYFEGFVFPYGFFGPEEYLGWLESAGLMPVRVELVPKDMVKEGIFDLASWIETTWLPYIERVPDNLQREFIYEIAERYARAHPPDEEGRLHVKMMRLEVVAKNVSLEYYPKI
jgi:trans-aconitate methyltransferase